MAELFTDEEYIKLIDALLQGHKDDDLPDEEMEQKVQEFVKWAEHVSVDMSIITSILKGALVVRWENGTPYIQLTDSGQQLAQEHLQSDLDRFLEGVFDEPT